MKKLNYIYKMFAVMLIITLSATSMKTVLASKTTTEVNDINITWDDAEPITLSAGASYYINNPHDIDDLQVSINDNENNCTSTPYYENEVVINEVIESDTLDKEIIEEGITEVVEDTKPETNNSSKYSENEIYELAKIIMAEAEGESQYCKELVGQVIMNRVNSEKHPNTIHDVIFANNGKTYQFSPVKPGGRWYRVEPNEACYEAAYTVLNASEPLTNALYFESCKGSSWHSRNLTLVIDLKEDNTRFYVP